MNIVRYAARPYQATWLHRVAACSTAGRASAVALLIKAKKRLVGLPLVYTFANALIPGRVIGLAFHFDEAIEGELAQRHLSLFSSSVQGSRIE
jgi:hypothetical protein